MAAATTATSTAPAIRSIPNPCLYSTHPATEKHAKAPPLKVARQARGSRRSAASITSMPAPKATPEMTIAVEWFIADNGCCSTVIIAVNSMTLGPANIASIKSPRRVSAAISYLLAMVSYRDRLVPSTSYVYPTDNGFTIEMPPSRLGKRAEWKGQGQARGARKSRTRRLNSSGRSMLGTWAVLWMTDFCAPEMSVASLLAVACTPGRSSSPMMTSVGA